MAEPRRAEALLFAAAFALRLGWIAEFSRQVHFDLPAGDGLFYAQQAARILKGHLLGTELSYPSSPLYPYLIAPLFLLPGRAAFWALYAAQAAVDAANAVLLRRAGTMLFGRAAGWAAGIAWAGYATAVFFTAGLVEAAPAAFLADLALLLLLRAASAWRDPSGPRPGFRPIVASGLALGAASLLRPHFLLVIPAASAAAAWIAGRGSRLRAAAALASGAAVLLLASAARNAAVSGEWVLVSPYSGLNAYLGNHRGARGDLSFPPGRGLRNDMDLRRAAHAYPEAVSGGSMTAGEVSRFWWAETVRDVRADPAAWAALVGRKCFLFWSSIEIPNHMDHGYLRGGSLALPAAAVPFGLIGPLALTSVVLILAGSRRGGAPGPGVLLFLTLAYAGGVVLFFVADRFRLPATGWLCLLAGGAVGSIFEAARGRRWTAAAVPALLAAALAVALHAPQPPSTGVRERVMAAAILAGRGRTAEAEALLRKAVAADPASPLARFNLGRFLARTDRRGEAESELREAARLAPDMAAAHAALADLARARGTPEGDAEALRHAGIAAALDPYGPEAERIRRAAERPVPAPRAAGEE
jgi:tetratricopeptide (TPR) repeat protein